MKKDIETKEDIEKLINHFYAQVVRDEQIGTFFNEVAPVNWEKHLPIMVGFWQFILFSTPNAYVGSVMTPHIHLNELKKLEPQHFDRWLLLFSTAVNELFEGTKAADAILAAKNIGATIKYKIVGSVHAKSITIDKIE
ncbi:MAG: group III truncated hemoglobin [Cytophagales bacterium]